MEKLETNKSPHQKPQKAGTTGMACNQMGFHEKRRLACGSKSNSPNHVNE